MKPCSAWRANPNPAVTHVLVRGNPHVPGDEVSPGFPALFQTKAPTIPEPKDDAKTAGRRKVLAAWITSAENRMTVRVMANRVWQFHFGAVPRARAIILASLANHRRIQNYSIILPRSLRRAVGN